MIKHGSVGDRMPIPMLISAVVPCLNEERFIATCIGSLLAQDLDSSSYEILLIVGPCSDATLGIAEEYSRRYRSIRVIRNPYRNTAVSFNLGIKEAKGTYLFTLSAHATYSSNYFSGALKYLDNYDCVGGVLRTMPRERTLLGKSICHALSLPFGVGNSRMRTRVSAPVEADTAACPGYRMEVFAKIGLFNEKLKNTQDMDFNRRLIRKRGRILLIPDIEVTYFARSDLRGFVSHNYRNGYWAINPLRYTEGIPVSWRHLVPMAFSIWLIGGGVVGAFSPIIFMVFVATLVAYIAAALYYATAVATKEKDLRFLILLPIIFLLIHLPYGLGSLRALIGVVPTYLMPRNPTD